MVFSTNPFLFVGKPVRDEYGRQIGASRIKVSS
jgi:hypothetical protein